MTNSRSKFAEFPWHVFLFVTFPILSLLANNTGQVAYSAAYRSLAVGLAASGAMLLAAKWFLRDWQKAGVLVTALNFLFFSYGHVYTLLKDQESALALVGRHRVLGAIWLGLFIFCIWWVRKIKPSILTSSLNLVTLFLLVSPIYTLVSFGYSNWSAREAEVQENPDIAFLDGLSASPDSPDVYFIVLDQYARSDILAEYFNYDNSDFLRELEDMGFYVASCSQSNYPFTSASLAGTLNLDYIPALGEEFQPGNKSFSPLWQAIKNSRAAAAFEQLGYQVVAFETGYNFTELENADVYYELSSRRINNFEALLLRNSATILPMDLGWFDQYTLTDDERKRERVLFVLDQLEEVPLLPGRKFVFVHLVMPHPPFVFGPQGETWVIPPYYENGETGYKRQDFRLGYHNQAVFISTRIVDTLRQIIANSPRPPIIILQADHGPITIPIEERLSILNAYLFPDPKPELYPALSPVNNFRLVFDTYFNASLPPLPDKSFFVEITDPYRFEEFENTCVPQE